MYSILIIEDDPSYISVMETILQMEGFDVCTAVDGESGLVMARKKRPDLILCDIMLPEMDGHSVLEALKGEVTLANVPFIFVTAMGGRADIRRGMSAGADDYLSKPFSADELLSSVLARIRRHEMINPNNKSILPREEALLFKKITRREREVLVMVAQGNTSRKIAELLGISLKTVEVHRTNLMNKLEVCNAASLARWAVIAAQAEGEPK